MQKVQEKEWLRNQMRARRDALSLEEIHIQTEKCLRQLVNFPPYKENEWIYTYMAIGSEVDTISMMQTFIKMGKKVAVPKVEGDMIAFYEIQSVKDCRPGLWGILEPVSYKAPAEEPGLILLPGLAFDERGNRLGYGGGYYDKYLKAHPDCECAALAYEMQVIDEVPREMHDRKVDYIITPERIITPPHPARRD